MNFSEDHSFITVKDFSVSGESFSLLLNEEYQLLKTHPQPTLDRLGVYYELLTENEHFLKKCIIL
jgi:hypothetical protein